MNRIGARAVYFAVMLGATFAGCTAPRPALVVSDPDPGVKIPAIRIAVDRKDLSVVRQLVKDLESDDPAVRFYAEGGLRRLTGEDFGFLYYEDAEAREPAVRKWQEWLANFEEAASAEK